MTPAPRTVLLLRAADPEPWAPADFAAALALLPPAMRAGILDYLRWQDRQARVLGRLLLRAGLMRLGLAAGLDAWTRDASGRPALRGVAVDFSISHAGGLALCAVSPGGRVGVDVEPRAARRPEDFRLGFRPAELREIAAAADPSLELLRLWTAKEAALKADGGGLLLDPGRIDARGAAVMVRDTAWRVSRPEVGAGWVCALATDAPDARVELLSLGLPELLAR